MEIERENKELTLTAKMYSNKVVILEKEKAELNNIISDEKNPKLEVASPPARYMELRPRHGAAGRKTNHEKNEKNLEQIISRLKGSLKNKDAIIKQKNERIARLQKELASHQKLQPTSKQQTTSNNLIINSPSALHQQRPPSQGQPVTMQQHPQQHPQEHPQEHQAVGAAIRMQQAIKPQPQRQQQQILPQQQPPPQAPPKSSVQIIPGQQQQMMNAQGGQMIPQQQPQLPPMFNQAHMDPIQMAAYPASAQDGLDAMCPCHLLSSHPHGNMMSPNAPPPQQQQAQIQSPNGQQAQKAHHGINKPQQTNTATQQQQKQPSNQPKTQSTSTKKLPKLAITGIQQAPSGDIILSWDLNDGEDPALCNEVKNYNVFAHRAPKDASLLLPHSGTAPPTDLSKWQRIGVLSALPLPMACSMSQFASGDTYNFAVLPVDKDGGKGLLSNSATIRPA